MALLYRGAGFGTYWHVNDARIHGFAPQSPGAIASIDRMASHIMHGSTKSPYISLSRSFGVARAYGIVGSGGIACASHPGYVYEIEIPDDKVCRLIDPVKAIATELPNPWTTPSYQHDGSQRFLLGIVDPVTMRHHLREHCVSPPGSSATLRSPNLSAELETLVRALRDAEVLVFGNIPASMVRNRFDVY
jgi:hypothetical protein